MPNLSNPGTSGRQETAFRKYVLQKRDGQICGICKKPIKDLRKANIDHIVPYCISFDSSLQNLQLAHPHCNTKKGGKHTTRIEGGES